MTMGMVFCKELLKGSQANKFAQNGETIPTSQDI